MKIDTSACLGKVPTHGDFVNRHASTPTMRALDKWMRKGLHYARKKHTPEWEEAYDQAAPKRFVLWDRRSNVPNVLLGVLASSRDARERTYPFMVTCEIPKHAISARHASYLPVQAESFFEKAAPLVRQAQAGEFSHRELEKRVDEMEISVTVKPTVPHRHKRYLKQEKVGPFFEALFGHFEDSQKYRLFSTLFDTLLPLRRRRASRLDQGMAFPLPDAPNIRTNIVAFWVGTVLRVLDYPSVGPTLFWTDPAAETDSAELMLYLGAPDPASFYDILVPNHNEKVAPLAQASENQSNAEAALSIPSEYGELLEDQHVNLWDFLRGL